MAGYFDTGIEFLKGVGPQKAALLNKELAIFNYGELLQHYPFRHEDRTQFYKISEVNDTLPFVQIKGVLRTVEVLGMARKQRLRAYLIDETGEIELVWFKAVQWMHKSLKTGIPYVVFGKATKFGSKYNMAHPEIEVLAPSHDQRGYLQPVYHSTEKLKYKFLDSKAISKLQKTLLTLCKDKIPETLPQAIIEHFKLISKRDALLQIHFPASSQDLAKANYRLKFEELFYIQLRLLKLKLTRQEKYRGIVFKEATLLTKFYNEHLPFELTNAQKKVIREIYSDMKSGKQMNRLLQGDVGSGKTIVAFICMMIAIDGGRQVTMMAPTEILANQHYDGLKPFADSMGLEIALLTGSSKKKARNIIHEDLESGKLNILIGTHAVLEDKVQFRELGLAIVDEQHRFGVAQRSKLWQKNKTTYPHMMVMTATPIPRTLAMTVYGDLDVSVIDELPAGRKPIQTVHRYDSNRLKVNGFMKEQMAEGRQIYVVYPLIEESETLDLKDLMDGYESVCRAFPEVPISILHGKMKSDAKDFEMQRFVKGETKIMVATTVIEVGVNVPNASVMIVENAERFGLAQLHQLRGRVGRGADQSYCILMSSFKLSKEARTRLGTMVRTNNGFEIADVDLKLRGPGDVSGTQQSGVTDLIIADLGKDGELLQVARTAVIALLDKDPLLDAPENAVIKRQVDRQKKSAINWSRIS
jgi:ATP-dependent DNA helicase RecG